MDELIGRKTLEGSLSPRETLFGSLTDSNLYLVGSITSPISPEVYTGFYEVEPKSQPIILDTEGKLLENDVTVKKIGLFEVSNVSGTTIYIGGD